MMKRLLLSTLTFAILAAPASAADTYTVDRVHSEVGFRVRHMIAKVPGRFNEFAGTIVMDREDPAKSSVEFTIQATSIDTANENRDNHLRSADFFDVEKFPEITFRSRSVRRTSDDEFAVTGDFTMHGVTRTITLPVTFNGLMKDARGNTRAGFDLETTVNRKDYGIEWNRALDEGGVLLGDDVDISISLSTVAQTAQN